MIRLQRFICILAGCFLFMGGLPVMAQSDDFNPISPGDPSASKFCRLNVSAEPAEGVYVSGGGRYNVNSGSVYVSSSANNTTDYEYVFKKWTLNGVDYSNNQSFSFTLREGTFNLVAHYERKEVPFAPDSPADPSGATIRKKYYLYLTSSIPNACSFNISSGEKHEEQSWVSLYANFSSDYVFKGWRIDGVIVNTSSWHQFQMPGKETTIEAVLEEAPFNPSSPTDPSDGSTVTPTQNRKIINVTIGTPSQSAVDRTRIVFNETKTLGYDIGTDNSKTISSDASCQIYSYNEDVKYSINERPVGDGVVMLGFSVKAAGTYLISVPRMDCIVGLRDKQLGAVHSFVKGAYSFEAEQGSCDDRFELFTPKGYVTGDANDDFEVSVADITAVVEHLKGNDIPTFNSNAADVDASGAVTLDDVKALRELILR